MIQNCLGQNDNNQSNAELHNSLYVSFSILFYTFFEMM
jgi:hypothetical protein